MNLLESILTEIRVFRKGGNSGTNLPSSTNIIPIGGSQKGIVD